MRRGNEREQEGRRGEEVGKGVVEQSRGDAKHCDDKGMERERNERRSMRRKEE